MIGKMFNPNKMLNVFGTVKSSLFKSFQFRSESLSKINLMRKITFNHSHKSKTFNRIGIYTITSLIAFFTLNNQK